MLKRRFIVKNLDIFIYLCQIYFKRDYVLFIFFIQFNHGWHFSAARSAPARPEIEKNDFEWFDFKLENFRKLLQRQKEENIQRSKVIFNILKTLSKSEFDYFETLEKEQKKDAK